MGAAREKEWESKNLPGVWEQQESRNGNINTSLGCGICQEVGWKVYKSALVMGVARE
jgi:hypothetical protein